MLPIIFQLSGRLPMDSDCSECYLTPGGSASCLKASTTMPKGWENQNIAAVLPPPPPTQNANVVLIGRAVVVFMHVATSPCSLVMRPPHRDVPRVAHSPI